jgi:hypothetical protein
MKHLAPIAIVLLVATPVAWSEEAHGVYAGDYVRVFTQPQARIEGEVYSTDDSTVVLKTGEGRNGEPQLRSISRDEILRADLRLRRSNRGQGALLGMLPGLALIGVGVALGGTYACSYCDIPEGAVPAAAGLLLVPIGAAVGALISGGHWQKGVLGTPSAESVRVGLTTGPDRKGVGVVLSIPVGRKQ